MDLHDGHHLAGVGEHDERLVFPHLAADLEGAAVAAPAATLIETAGVDDEAVGRGFDRGGVELLLDLAEFDLALAQVELGVFEFGLLRLELAGVARLDAFEFGLRLADIGLEAGFLFHILVFFEGFLGEARLEERRLGVEVGDAVLVEFVLRIELVVEEFLRAVEFHAETFFFAHRALQRRLEVVALLDQIAVGPLLQFEFGQFELDLRLSQRRVVVALLDL
ncbi:MAG: hypothetical protein R3B46_13625 [Phycisphaerales bacterium]